MFPDDDCIIISEPYSLNHVLNNDVLAPQFIGGTVYQAFLSATKYHRWHSPVNGTVSRIVTIPGTYYAESPATGFPSPDPGAPNLSLLKMRSAAYGNPAIGATLKRANLRAPSP
ncbi:hypothetical protein DFS33DRAFT_1447633 [Desarmillaria ectypa]|nr:hypothetical protein DFS33DRAFT_1447633 [Desarmillaria ectypa]